MYKLQYWERKSRRMKLYVLKMRGNRKGFHHILFTKDKG
ncbi:hypothetical protein B4077_3771 [Bacillus cereus]|uniref:Uncharacterized protein n=1 Tax=Bacillus cereus TaxID=1396 RepID=A0A0G8F247_BACCE|nr:hypothetical protein B4077_3771 [Bacillus cereus]